MSAAPAPDAFEPQDSGRPKSRPRRGNRKHVIEQRRSPVLWLAAGAGFVGRGLWTVFRVVGTVVAAVGLLAALVVGGRWAVAHVAASPRFALHKIVVSAGAHIKEDDVLALADLDTNGGARLLAIDPDEVAARVAQHPWALRVRVERQLPSTLAIEVDERQAPALVALGGLYLVDDTGRPFKRASTEDAQDLPIITGIDREQYNAHRELAEAAVREGLAVLRAYQRPGSAMGRPVQRPTLSEVNLHARHGVTLYLLDSGTEIRLGRGQIDEKLARLDRIFEAVSRNAHGGAAAALGVVHLDGSSTTKVTVRLSDSGLVDAGPLAAISSKESGKDSRHDNRQVPKHGLRN